MKKKSLFVMMLIAVMAASLFMTSCSKLSKGGEGSGEPQNLEEYAVSNPEVQKSIDEAMADSDVEVAIKGNEVIYSFELSKMEGYTEDVAKDPTVIENLQKALDNAGPTFGGIAKTLESVTGLSGIQVVVIYTYDDETIANRTFDASDAAAEGGSSEPAEGEDGESEEGGADSADSDDSAE